MGVLELREAAVPEPSEGEVLIKVAAAGINFADIMARLGLYPDAPKSPCVVGYEVAGEVAAVGSISPLQPTTSAARIAASLRSMRPRSGVAMALPSGRIFYTE